MKKFLFFLALLFAASVLSAQTIVYHENFDPTSNADSVDVSGATNNFAINTRLFHSGTQCDSTLVSANDTAFLTTHSFSTMGFGYVFLNFSHICKIELLDGGEVQVSTDNGLTWTNLTGAHYVNPGNSQFVTNGNKFNSNTYPLDWAPATGTTKPTNIWWKNESFNISALVGNQPNVKIRFALRDGNGNGAFFNHGWYIDDISVSASLSELTPPVVTMKPPVIQDTVFYTGPFDIYAWITDASGIDTAYIDYQLNGGPHLYIPMVLISDSTYKGTIPTYTYGNQIDYHVHAVDNSVAHNSTNGTNQWFYVKKPKPFVVVGTGTSSSYLLPTNGLYNYSWGAQLYLASELNFSGLIDSIEFYVSSVTPPYTMNNQRVFIGHTSMTSYGTSQPDTTQMTLIYNGTCTFNNTGWYQIAPQSPFSYNGSSNLLIYWVNKDGTWTSGYPNFAYTSTSPDYLGTYMYDDTYSLIFPTSSGTQTYNRPNLRITYASVTTTDDAGVKQILTPTGTIIAGVNSPVTLQIKNFGIDTLKKANIAWKLDGVLQTPYPWFGVLPEAITSGTFSIGNVNVGVGPHKIIAWTELPNDSVDQNHLNDTASISFYACSTTLNGTYTVGGGGADYPTFADVMTALNNCGVGGPTIFKINGGTYNNQLTFNSIFGASAINTITFMPNTGATVTIVDSSSASTIKFNGADYIIFDGSNNGSSSRNMTIKNTNVASNTSVIWMASAGSSLGCVNNVIKNCIIRAGDNTSGIYGIFIGGPTIGTTGADNDNNIIQNNDISKAYIGIWAQGSAASNPGLMDSLLIKDNNIGSTVVNRYIGHDGIMLGNASGCTIEKNTIFNIITSVTTPVGLTLSAGVVSSNVIKNNINNIVYTATGGYGGRGAYFNTGSGSSNLTIADNIVYKIGGDGYSSFTNSSPVGLYFDGTMGGLNIYYNSVYMSGDLTYTSSTLTTAILFNSTSITGIELKNNVFQNSMNNTGSSSAKNYAIYSMASSSSFIAIDYNDYYVSGTQGVLGFLGSDQTTISEWRTATAQDVNSMNIIPDFLSTTDLQTFSPDLNGHGTPITAITDDINGNLRNTTAPDLGAYEFDIAAINIALVAIIQPVSNCSLSANADVIVRVKNNGIANIDTADLYYSINGGTAVHETMIHTIMPDSSYNYTFATKADLSAPLNYTFKVYAHLNGDTTHINDTIQNYTIYSGYNFNNGAYTQSFEPTEYFSDWSTLDVNADSYGWTIPVAGNAHTGNNSVQLYNGGANAGNDWLFSRCFNMNAGSSYKIDFWYKASYALSPQTIDIMVGNDNTVAAMTTTLKSLVSFTNTAYQMATVTFTPASSGTYYFGWWGHSALNYDYAYIDDINIALLPPQEAALVGITSPITGCGLSATEPVSIKIHNSGGAMIIGNLTAKYKIVGGSTTVSEAVAQQIAVNDTLNFTFGTPADLSVTTQDSTFEILSWVELIGDPIHINDTVLSSIQSYHLPANPTVVSDTVSYGGIGVLHANASDSLYWYSVPTGGTSIGTGSSYTTTNLYGTTVYYVEARTGAPNIKITEVTQYSSGTGATSPYPSWFTTSDWDGLEVSNLGSAVADLTGYSVHIEGPSNIDYTIPAGVTLAAGEVMVLSRYGAPADDPAHKFYVMSTSGSTSSGVANGYYIKNAMGEVVDAVATDSYTFSAGSGVTALDWSGNIGYDGGYAGVIRTISDNNSASDWSIASTSAPQTIGSLNPTLTVGSGGGGCASARIPDTAYVTGVPACDMSVQVIHTPNSGVLLTSNEVVSVRVKNYGTATAVNVPIHYVVNGGTIVDDIIPSVPTTDTVLFTFATPVNLSVFATYSLKVYTDLPCDTTVVNDTAYKVITCSPLVYCTSIPSNTADEEIFSVTLNGSTNAYDCSTVAPGPGSILNRYSNFTTLPPLTTLSMGVPTAFTILEDECDGVTYYQNGIGIWIDLNRDGDFTDAGEQVFVESSVTYSPRTVTGNITVPPGAYSGITTMRIICAEGSAGASLQPCMTYSYGETEDYSIYIAPPIPHDAGVVSFIQPATLVHGEGVSLPVQMVVKNFGLDTIKNSMNMTVAYSYNGGTPQSIIWSGGDIPPLDTVNVTLPNFTVVPSSLSLCGWTVLAGDSNTFNDTTCITIKGIAHKDAGVELIEAPIGQAPVGSHKAVKVRIHNFGSDTLTSIPVSFKANNGNPTTETWTGQLLPNDFVTYQFVGQVTVLSGAFALCSYTGLPLDADHLNDTTCVTFTGIQTFIVPYSDNFEGTVYFYTDSTLWEHGIPTASTINTAYSPTQVWATNLDGNYTNDAEEYLYTPFFNFTFADSAYLDFYHWYDTQSATDGGNIQYSVNGGNWLTLGLQNDMNGLNWYNATANGAPCWAASSGGYVHSRYKLHSLSSNPIIHKPVVQFRFHFFSDASTNNFNGWAVDNFQIIVPPAPIDAGVSAIMQPNAPTQTGAPVTVVVTVKNFGTTNLLSTPVRYTINGGPVVSETWTGNLAPSGTDNYTFATPYTSPGAPYDLCAFTHLTGDTYFWNDSTCGHFDVTPGNNDVGILNILSPGNTTVPGQSYTVTVSIKNFGINTQTSFPLVYTRNLVQVGAGTYTGTPLNSGDTAVYTFATTYVAPLGNYSLCAKTQLVGDADPANDEKCIYPTVGVETYDYSSFQLLQNIPNPSNNHTSIIFIVPSEDKIRFDMIDLLGNNVMTKEADATDGKNQFDIDVTQIPAGIYFYSVSYKDQKRTKRMVITK
jgi:hypothetical protein